MGSPPGISFFVAGEFTRQGQPLLVRGQRFLGPDAGHEPLRIGIFSGIHGDEPAGPRAVVEFIDSLLAQPGLAAGYDLWAYPEVNPIGCQRGVRENGAGRDLNREFWRESAEPEVRIVEAELLRRRFHGLIALHADDTCVGHYGYSHGRPVENSLLLPALEAAERILPRDHRERIDGFSASEGVITDCYAGILSPPPTQNPRPFNLIFETPATAALDLQVAAHVAALHAILATYRAYVSYSQGI